MKALGTYFETLSAAIEEAIEFATDRDYIVDENDIFNYSIGGISYEETKPGTITLYTAKGNQARKALQLSIYRMKSGRYELTAYIW